MSSCNQDLVQTDPEYHPNGLRRSLRKKYAVKATRVQPLFEGRTHRPTILKEGYLHKPSFFRFGGKRRRWCVLRSYSAVEASLDIFVDDTKSRYKGSICLDKEAEPAILVKSVDEGRKGGHQQPYYIILKVGKNSYHFTTESCKELKEWCALLRQIIDPAGSLFSASIVEPSNLDDGTVNVQFSSNYIALICPLREISIKRWRLEHITSFGQCSGILTYECCTKCSDPAYNRCSLNIKQEKPSTILSLMEKTIRENPNTSEIHYERSILGDIYHCSHQCTGSSPRLLSALSDTNLTKVNGINFYTVHQKPGNLKVNIPTELRHSETDLSITHSNTLESNDSGFPETPQLDDEPPRSADILSSPVYFPNNPSSPQKRSVKSVSPTHRYRSNSERYTPIPSRDSITPGRETDDSSGSETTPTKIPFTTAKNASLPSSARSVSPGKGSTAGTNQTRSLTPSLPLYNYNKLETVQEPPPTPPERRESRFRSSSNSPPNTLNNKQLKSYHIPVGIPPPPPKVISKNGIESRLEQVRDSSMDRDHPVADDIHTRQRRGTNIIPRELPSHLPRERSQSQSDHLEGNRPAVKKHRTNYRSSADDQLEGYESFDELKTTNPFFRLDELEYDETDGEGVMEVMSNLADYKRHKNGYCEPAVIDKVLSKVACDNVRGYAYKISIPVVGDAAQIYDVPRRSAPMADPNHMNPYAPPKPLRQGIQQH